MIEEELRKLDFTDNEIKIYLVLLRIGHSKAGRIAKECGLERTSTYASLKRLQEKGMISSITEANKRVFSPADPEKIVDIFKEKEEQAGLLIPKLKEMRKFEREKEIIQKFRGYAGVKTVLNDVLRSSKPGEEYLIMGAEGQLSERMPVYSKIYVSRKDKKKLKARILVREEFRLRGSMSKYTKARFVPQEVVSTASTNIYGDKVAIIIWSEIPEAIIIDDKITAETYRSYFNFMWDNAKK